ncbi:MAG: hypothetical protein QGM45_09835, partial [Anaerolineales bacterium]|nr:hypothetical protein [Anaerolineales bacterium]
MCIRTRLTYSRSHFIEQSPGYASYTKKNRRETLHASLRVLGKKEWGRPRILWGGEAGHHLED